MPNYRTHSFANLFLILPPISLALYHFLTPSEENILTFIGCFTYATLFMSPDVDLAHKNKLFSLKGLLTLPFRPYALFFSHRGISHLPVIGTLTRLLYLFFLFFLIYILLYKEIPALYITSNALFIWGFGGACLADIAHECLDFFD